MGRCLRLKNKTLLVVLVFTGMIIYKHIISIYVIPAEAGMTMYSIISKIGKFDVINNGKNILFQSLIRDFGQLCF